VNGDLARNVRRRVKPSVSRSGEGTSAGRAHRIENGSESTEAHGDVRASSSGLRGQIERSHGGRGTGVVMATGSYEGSLSREGILVCWQASVVTDRRGRQAWQLPHHDHFVRTPNRTTDGARTGESTVSDVVNGKKRQGCQRLD
jgi:hypothetical protein